MSWFMSASNSVNNKKSDDKSILDSLDLSQAIIEFEMDGTIITANKNFLDTMEYSLQEVRGQHHSIFVDTDYARTSEYREFWASLKRGEFDTKSYKRFGKNKKEVWIQASYNPVFDEDGKPYKVIKIASDITEQKQQQADHAGKITAIGKSQAVIEFDLQGNILTANENFLATLGYTLSEIQGKHHSMFAEPSYAKSADYQNFWNNLRNGNFDSGEYKRLGKNGKEIWIQASYNPIFDLNGNPYKVVKFASDVTEQKIKMADFESQIQAIGKSQAVIEFDMNGIILKANDNFLNTVGYSMAEIQGRHHSMFAESQYASSAEYKEFWAKLNRGEFDSGEYRRLGKGNKEVWIQASYNPIFDLNGNPFKVVKYATDITERKQTFADVTDIFSDLAKGDLSASINVNQGSEFEEFANNLNSFTSSLRDMVSSIKDSATNVLSGAEGMAVGNNNLSNRTEQQAANLEETAASMDEITSTVQQTATNANRANELVLESQKQAIKGGEVVNEAVAAMSEINDASNHIAEIISVIDEIAFQTNLLALNASVEAARAGEQGRGFAVVASEVRNLAGRSATAAKEIKELIEDSVKKVSHGSDLVGLSGETLQEIVGGVKNVTNIVSEIATAADEQSIGVSEVHKALGQLQALTQQNTAMVEEAAAASEELGSQARTLNENMNIFSGVDAGAAVSSQPERRSSNRAWNGSGGNTKKQKPVAQPVQNVVNQSFEEDDWEEF